MPNKLTEGHLSCTRIIEFDAGHRLTNHESKCAKLHGHRYKGEFTFVAKSLDHVGRIIDFGVVKHKVGSWIDDNLDHNVILHIDDKALGDFINHNLPQKVYYMNCNPTTENIARHLLHNVIPSILNCEQVKCTGIKLWETPNCFAEVKI